MLLGVYPLGTRNPQEEHDELKVQCRCRKPNLGHPARSKTLNTMKYNSRHQTIRRSDADLQQACSLWTNSSSVQKRLKPHLIAQGKIELMCVSYFSPHLQGNL